MSTPSSSSNISLSREWSIVLIPNPSDPEQTVDATVTSTDNPHLTFTCTFLFASPSPSISPSHSNSDSNSDIINSNTSNCKDSERESERDTETDRQREKCPFEGFCNPQRWSRLTKRLTYKPSDILIVSYPKCGTTWMEQIVLLLLCNGEKELMNPAYKNTFQALVEKDKDNDNDKNKAKFGKIWPDVAIEQDPEFQHRMGKQAIPISWEEFDNMPVQNRVMKSHSHASMLLGTDFKGLEPLPSGMKVLIVTRNPFDACVSSYFYGFNACRNGWPFDAWANLWLTGNVGMGSWFDFVKGWHEQIEKFPGKALWIHYEDLKENPKQQIDRVAKYLEIQSTSPEEYETLINNVVEHSSFSCMKEQADAVDSKSTGHIDHHLRKGLCGDWRNFFEVNSELYQAFVSKFHDALDGTSLAYKLGEGSDELKATMT